MSDSGQGEPFALNTQSPQSTWNQHADARQLKGANNIYHSDE